MKKTIRGQALIRVRVALVAGVLLILLSPLIAYLAAPIGCVLFPPAIDPNA